MTINPTAKGMDEFHIHVDATEMDDRLKDFLLRKLNFEEKNFVRDDMRGAEHSPVLHVTKKYWHRVDFERDYQGLESRIADGLKMIGYIEGEYIILRKMLEYRKPNPRVPIPFKVEQGDLSPGTFKETELHLTIDRDSSDPKAIEQFFDMGLYCAYAPKDYGMAQIITVQGKVRQIEPLRTALIRFVEERGGFRRAKIMEERIIRWWVSSEDVELPPVVRNIAWQPATVDQS